MSDSEYNYTPAGSPVYKSPDTSKDLVSWEHILGKTRIRQYGIECQNCCLGGRFVQVNDTHVCGFEGVLAKVQSDIDQNCTEATPLGRYGALATVPRILIDRAIDGGSETVGGKNQSVIIPNCYATFSNVIIAQPFEKVEPSSSVAYPGYNVNWLLSFLLLFCVLLIQKKN